MKVLVGVLFLTILLQYCQAEEKFDWSQLTLDQIKELQQKKLLKVKKGNIERLKKAKQNLISGKIKQAEKILHRITHANDAIMLVRDRYLSLISFIEEDFTKSYQIISKNHFLYPSAYRETCQLKLLNQMIIFPDKKIKDEFIKCALNVRNFSKNDLAWLNAMVELHQKNFSTSNNNFVRNFNQDTNDIIKTWMKISLFSNQEENIIKKVKQFPESAFYSKKIREMTGLAYYRAGNYDVAMDFVEDISSANAEIIKGSIALLKKEYEIAFGHFQVALMKKSNSLNALERAIPLAWSLEQWEEGIKMLNKRLITKENERNIITLNTAFKIRLDQFENSYKQLQVLELLFSKKLPKEVFLMDSFISAMRGDEHRLAVSATESCRKHDGLNCWLIFHLDMWEHLGKTVQRDSLVVPNGRIDIDEWKQTTKITPMKEQTLLNQSDIEELDDSLVTIKN